MTTEHSPENDNMSGSQLQIGPEEYAGTAAERPPEPSPFQPPRSIREKVAASQEENSAKFDRVDDQAQTTGMGTRERAGTLTAEDTDRIAAGAARKMLARQPKTKTPKTRRGLGSRQLLTADGPPAHVAKENREELGIL